MSPTRRTRGRAGPGRESVALFRALLRCFGLLRRVMEPHFRQFGINGAQWGVLRTLRVAEEAGEPGLRLGEIAERLIIRPPSVSSIVTRLRRRGLVEVDVLEQDRRARRASLTDAGRDLLAKARDVHLGQIERLAECLGAEEKRALKTMLDRLNEHLEVLAE